MEKIYDRVYIDSQGFLYDEVKWHTRLKHKFIETYLDLWINNVKNNQPTLDIFDLYAGTGFCYCNKSDKYDLDESTWGGTAYLACNCLRNYPKGRYLFLNSYHPDEEACNRQIENLKNILNLFGEDRVNQTFFCSSLAEVTVDEALEFAYSKKVGNNQSILQYPTLWILDPHAARQLPWDVVEKIGGINFPYVSLNGKKRIRKPEMIINLMTSDLQRNVNNHPQVVSIALGLDEKVWRPLCDQLIEEGNNTREALIKIYSAKLFNLYGTAPIVSEIKSTNETNIVYALFFCTNHEKSHYLMKLKGLDDYRTWIPEWKKVAKIIKAKDGLASDQTTLF